MVSNCHHTAMLKVGDQTILTIPQGEPVYVVVGGVYIKDILSNVVDEMMKVSNDCNQLHGMRKRRALVEWLVKAGFKIEIESKRIGDLLLGLLEIGRPYQPTMEDAGTFADAFLENTAPFTYKETFE